MRRAEIFDGDQLSGLAFDGEVHAMIQPVEKVLDRIMT